MTSKTGCVYLVGAGCGEADLITMRGAALLKCCDVVVYDDLIDEDLLAMIPKGAKRVYMGKRSGKHSALQCEISEALVALASEGNVVVRLKGGDPFVFGRGGEEALALKAAGIPFEEVPGISSSIAIPAAAGIPVTHRGASQSFHVITAHTADTPDGLPAFLDDLAHLQGTLVFLMGLAQLPAIAKRLTAAGMSPDTPAAVVSGGNSPNPATERATLATIADRVREEGVRSPAVIVVGNVAAMDLSATIKKPLQGVRIGLTGTAAVTEKLKPALAAYGAQVFFAERSAVEVLPFDFPAEKICNGKPHWLVFTSSNGVRIFFDRLRKQHIDLRRLHACRFAVIGQATAETLARYGIVADLCPEVYTSEALGACMVKNVPFDEDVYLFRSRKGSKKLLEVLSAHCAAHDVPTYDLYSDPETEEQAKPLLETTDYLTFSSASGVELFFEAHQKLPENATCVCIGEVTAKALARRCDRPFLTASEISAEGIVDAILANEAHR
jgi:uroporphyrinogen III methyltransferase/synthase